MSLDVVQLTNRRYAVVGFVGDIDEDCGERLCAALRPRARVHTIVDLRQAERLSPLAAKSLLTALGTALDRGRTLRVVVRDRHQRAYLTGLGLGGLVPMHASLPEATEALEVEIAATHVTG